MRSLKLQDVDDDFVYVSDLVDERISESSPADKNCKSRSAPLNLFRLTIMKP
jgi:hypothetical protein